MTAVPIDEGLALIRHHAAVQPAVRLPLADALGHVLAEAPAARWPLPAWTAAAMDGYAVRAGDVRGATRVAPVILPLAGGGHAGDPTPPPLPPGTAWRVATGGRVPDGADSVVRQEDTAGEGRGTNGGDPVTILSDRDAGRNVRPAGSDVAQGAAPLPAGTRLGPGQLAMLAALGVATPMVHRHPRVGILTSGDEVAPLGDLERIAAGERLPDANGPMLHALVARAGGVPVDLGLVADDPAQMREAIERATDVDLILTAGGISVGAHDHVPAVMAALGAVIRFRRVRIRPGGPTTFATLPDGRPWLALPGNPVSAFVTFHVFASAAIRQMSGDSRPEDSFRPARLGDGESVARHPTLDLYLRVTLSADPAGGPPIARLTGHQGSWVQSSIALADALAIVPAGEGTVDPGARLKMLLVTGDASRVTSHPSLAPLSRVSLMPEGE